MSYLVEMLVVEMYVALMSVGQKSRHLINNNNNFRPHTRIQPPQPPMWPVPRTRSGGGMSDFQPSPYLDYSDNNADYMSFDQQKGETLPPPPEKVEEAFETIKEYLKNPDSIEDVPGTTNTKNLSTPSPKTTTTTTTTTTSSTTTAQPKSASTPLTTTTTTTTQMLTSSEKRKSSHRKKPLSSFDNDTETDVTLRTVFNNYGVAQENIGFILDASYSLMVTGLLLLW